MWERLLWQGAEGPRTRISKALAQSFQLSGKGEGAAAGVAPVGHCCGVGEEQKASHPLGWAQPAQLGLGGGFWWGMT